MDETYRAKLSGAPPGDPHSHAPDGPAHPHSGPMNNTTPPGPGPQPIPVQLPNIYVNPYPPPPPPNPAVSEQQHRHREPHHHATITPGPPTRMMHLGPFRFARPHPLLWISLALSLVALVLEVPKGSLPTLTGRHKALRMQEKLVNERLNLLTRLSTFLPPPLAGMLNPQAQHQHQPDVMRFWNTNANALSFAGAGVGQAGQGDRWWSVEDLGEGASVVRSRSGAGAGGAGGCGEREVWVLRVGADEHGDNAPLLNALTHSLLLRDRLLSEMAQLQASQTASTALSTSTAHHAHDHDHDHEQEYHRREREREVERRKRDREREREVEEREREVGRREKWVIEEMRQLSDKVHAEASELTLEDRITERLKAYQRQLGRLSDEKEREREP